MAELSYIFTPETHSIIYETIHELLRKHAIEHPHTVVYIHRHLDDRRYTITNLQLYTKATSVAKYLIKCGIRPADCVAILGPNSIEWIICEIGIIMAGAVAVHLTLVTKDAREVIDACDQSECKAIFMDVENVLACSFIEESFLTNGRCVIHMKPSCQEVKCTLQKILESPEVNVELPRTYPEDDAFIFTTSGSTGKPKFVVRSHVSMQSVLPFLNPTQDQIVGYVDRPFAWLLGHPLVSIVHGDVRVFMTSENSTDSNSVTKIWNIISEENCAFAIFMPFFLTMLDGNVDDLTTGEYKLQRILTGGQLVGNFVNFVGVLCEQLINGYGSTETNLISYKVTMGSTPGELGDVGNPGEGVEVRIVDTDDKPVKRNCLGSIQVRNQFMFDRYLGNDELTSKIKTRKGWIRTEDIGKITTEGTLIIKGREKDIISRGTRKLLPSFIEENLEQLDQLYAICVIAVPDNILGEEVCACYIPQTGEDITPVAAKQMCENIFLRKEDSIDGIGEMPTYFLRVDEFPLLTTGKIDKQALVKRAVVHLGLSV